MYSTQMRFYQRFSTAHSPLPPLMPIWPSSQAKNKQTILSRRDFIAHIHQSTIGHQISEPDDATCIGRDTVAINHSKSRWLELFLVNCYNIVLK